MSDRRMLSKAWKIWSSEMMKQSRHSSKSTYGSGWCSHSEILALSLDLARQLRLDIALWG